MAAIHSNQLDLKERRHCGPCVRFYDDDIENGNMEGHDPTTTTKVTSIHDHHPHTTNPPNVKTCLIQRRWCGNGGGGTSRMVIYKKSIMAGLVCFLSSIMVNLEFFDILNKSLTIRMVTVQQQESHPPQKRSTSINNGIDVKAAHTANHHSNEHTTSIRPFPKWGSTIAEELEIGISFPPILSFIQTSSPYKGLSHYYRSTLDHSTAFHPHFPETLYMIQPSVNDDTDSFGIPNPPTIHNSMLHRLRHNGYLAMKNETLNRGHKLNSTERVMLHALDILHQEVATNIDNRQQDGNVCLHTQWPFLCQNLYPSLQLNSIGSASTQRHNTTLIGGFPFLVWYGDYIGCNYHNWKQPVDTNSTGPISWNDLETHVTENVSIPLFTVAAQSKDCNYTMPFPNFYQISDTNTQWDIQMEQNRADYPWSQKIPKIVWRGSLTGRIDNNKTKCPRWKMVETIYNIEKQRRELHGELAKATATTTRNADGVAPSESLSPISDHQELFDAKLTSILQKQYQSQLEHEIGDQPIGRSKLPFHDFQKYRGIIDIDGHSWSGRFGSLLCMNSVILKVDPNYVEYFYARRRNGKSSNDLQAWKHYIPIRADFSNLEEMAEYVLDPANDDALLEMVHQANEWCRQNMIVSRIMMDMLDVWDRYVELLNINNDQWLEQYWTNDVQSSILENDNLNMVLLNISDYPPILKGQ